MLNKKLIILSIFSIILLAVSTVSASDDIANDIVSVDDANDIVNTDLDSGNFTKLETSSSKTFSDLNKAINGNSNSNIYLDSDYTFNSDSDTAFVSGIVIDRQVTIYGNGHTIDASKSARIFSVTATKVVFKDIIFVNASTTNCDRYDDMGATIKCDLYDENYDGVYGSCTAINCTFIKNSAGSFGGAMFGGSAIDCTFTGNYAHDGSAISDGDATNCIFTENSAKYSGTMVGGTARNCIFDSNSAGTDGAAINSGNAINCTFINNHATGNGGAIYQGSADNCTFNSNSAKSGGATYESNVVNSIFVNNHATENGGAMFDGSATNCTFNDNSADNGGAISSATAIDCTFTMNTADNFGGAAYNSFVGNSLFEENNAYNGGAVYGMEVINCTFNNNSASTGSAVSNAKVSDNSIFGNNGDNAIDNVVYFDSENMKTFSDLNKIINGNSNANIYLTSNYTFNFVRDSKFEGGINITNRVLNIYGNGFTINGDYFSRIFNLINSTVIFHDVVFINGRISGWAGAINGKPSGTNIPKTGKSKVINCTFIGNTADYGGAIDDVDAINCTFNNNYATGSAGAMTNGVAENCIFYYNSASNSAGAIDMTSALNCTFIHNYASWGGAIMLMGEFIKDCTFINNSAGDSGAISGFGSIQNCTFINNYASTIAGAISWIDATDSTFINNSASVDGGAMYGGSATNCTFINNYAVNNGGAIYSVDAEKSTFILNTASGNGGAMYEGTAINCTFINNHATNGGSIAYNGIIHNAIVVSDGGVDYYNTVILNPTISAVKSTSYNYGDKVLVSFGNLNGYEIGVPIDVNIYQSGKLVKSTTLSSGSYLTLNLNPGSYDVVFSVRDSSYKISSVTAKISINKLSTSIDASSMSAQYNSNTYLYITLKDGAGRAVKNAKVTVSITGKTTQTYTTDSNGKIKISTNGWSLKTYTVTMIYKGDSSYYNAAPQKIVKITVVKATPSITASSKTFNVKTYTKYFYITLKDKKGSVMKSKKVTLKVNGRYYYGTTNSNGVATFKITKLTSKGKFTAVITYAGSSYYNKVSKSVYIYSKGSPKMYAYAKTFKLSTKTKVYTVTLKNENYKVMKNTKITVKAYGVTYTAYTNSKGIATFKITNLVKRGIYTVDVSYAGSNYYYAVTKKVKLTAK